MPEPWKDWLPGVLSRPQLLQLQEIGAITCGNGEDLILDASAIDLTIAEDFWKLIRGTVKPAGNDYGFFLNSQGQFSTKEEWNDDHQVVINPGETYVFKLRERLESIFRTPSKFYGEATGKSSIGRVDVLTRLIVQGMDHYERFSPEKIRDQNGELFLEVTPMTFPVIVKPGISLSQLRIFYGHPSISEIKGSELFDTVLRKPDGEPDGSLRVDLNRSKIAEDQYATAFKAKTGNLKPIQLWKDEQSLPLNPKDYWEPTSAEGDRLTIEKSNFYILRSKEKLSLTLGVAVYCRATDEALGEMRIHYAGFVHPGFGRILEGGDYNYEGTPLIFEVRGHDVNVVLNDNERLAHLQFYRMSQDCTPDDIDQTPYQSQDLKLSKFFEEWT